MRERYLRFLLILLTFTIWINLLSCNAQLPIGKRSIPGIDEPVLIKNVSMTCIVVGSQTIDFELTLKNAYAREMISTKDGDRFPKDSSIFYTLLTDINVLGNCLDMRAVSGQLKLDCGDENFEPLFSGGNVDLGDGSGRKGFTFTFEIPINTSTDNCVLLFLDGQTIPIAPLISD